MFLSSKFNYFYCSSNEFGNFYEQRKSKCRAFRTTKSKYDFDKVKNKRKMRQKSKRRNNYD